MSARRHGRALVLASPRASLRGSLLGIGGVAVAWWLLSLFPASQVGTTAPAVVFVLVVLLAATVGGLLAGVVTSLAAFAALTYGFVQPIHDFSVDSGKAGVALAVFLAVAVAVSLLTAAQAEARQRVAESADESARLERLASALGRARSAAAVFDVVLDEGREALGASAGMIALLDGDEVELAASFGFNEAESAGWARFPRSAATPITDAMRLGEPVFVEQGGHGERYPNLPASDLPTASLPLVAGDQLLGGLGLRFPPRHSFPPGQRALAVRLADHCARAIERARLFDAEERARRALGLLAAAGEQLARSLDPADALGTLAELVTPEIADHCLIDLVEGSTIRRVVVVNADPALDADARRLERYAPALDADTPIARVIRSGRAELVGLVANLPPEAYLDEEHHGVVERLALRCILTVPLIARGRTLGALTLGSRRPNAFDPDAVELAGQLGRRVALALDNAALYQRAEQERERLDALLRQLPLGVVMADAPAGRAVMTNERAAAILGEAGQVEPIDAVLARAAAGESTEGQEVELRRADGTRMIVVVSGEPVRDVDGRVVAAILTLFDLTGHRESEERLSFLAAASSVLASSLDSERTLQELARLAVPRMADWCAISLLERGTLRSVAVAHVDPAKVALARELERRYPPQMDAPTGAAAVARTGRSELLAEIPDAVLEAASPDAELLATLRELGLRSAITVPLIARGRTMGTMSLISAESGRRYGEADVALAEDLAARAALAVENAQLYEAQRAIAHTLQQSLLPGRMPRPGGVDVAVSYRPAGLGAEVGGDFYDGWEVAGGHAYAIGDVAGKGPRAAALTSLVRHTMRVASRFLSSPARILEVVNDAVLRETDGTQFCTAVLAIVTAADDGFRCTLACAGHPAPLVLRGGGVARTSARGTLLGVVPRLDIADHEQTLQPGDLLVLWTDGVTERRLAGELYGERRLERLLARFGGGAAADVVRAIEEDVVAFAPALPDDDMAILTIGIEALPLAQAAARPSTAATRLDPRA